MVVSVESLDAAGWFCDPATPGDGGSSAGLFFEQPQSAIRAAVATMALFRAKVRAVMEDVFLIQ